MKKRRPPIFLQIQRWSSFMPKTRAQIVPKTLSHSPIELSYNKNKIVAHPTDHGNAPFSPIQQPTNNIAAQVLV
jgi:hypothetical protein